MDGAADHGRGDCGLRVQVSVAGGRRGALDGIAEFALLAGKVRAHPRHRRRRTHLDRHGRNGRGVFPRCPCGYGGGGGICGLGSPLSRMESVMHLLCRLCDARPCGELHDPCQGRTEPCAPRDQSDSLHPPRLSHGGTLRWLERGDSHAVGFLVGCGNAANGAVGIWEGGKRVEPQRDRNRCAPLRGGGWYCRGTDHCGVRG